MISTPVELSNSANSLKSLFNIRMLGKPLLSQHFDSGNPRFKSSGQPIVTVTGWAAQGFACRYFFH